MTRHLVLLLPFLIFAFGMSWISWRNSSPYVRRKKR